MTELRLLAAGNVSGKRMLHSMTGFARQNSETAAGTLTCEIRAVNHRYLDVQFRLPDELKVKETELKTLLAGTLKRGKIECHLHLKRASGQSGNLMLDDELITTIADRLRNIGSIMPGAADPDPMDVLRWPGVVLEPVIEAETLFDDAAALLATTLDGLAGMRRSEGERIEGMLESRCDEIRRIAGQVRGRMPEVLEAVRAKQRERLDKLDIDANPERLEVELALVAQKLDVDEELDRLESHVVEILSAMGLDEPVGRRLDFLMQELNREANTLGSKSGDAETTRAAVELKVLIEQMREQIQNIE